MSGDGTLTLCLPSILSQCVCELTCLRSQIDNHNGNLTVTETMLYAFACQSGLRTTHYRVADDVAKIRKHNASSREGAAKQDVEAARNGGGDNSFESILLDVFNSDARVALWMNLFGLFHCKDTMVGDAMNRGVSGGEKKRLTTAEMLVVIFFVMLIYEIYTGLDSATLYSVVKWLSQMSHALRPTCLISLLQPPPETFQLFDDVMMISDGVILYHGRETSYS